MGITDSWVRGKGLVDDTHNRGILNEWEPISRQLKAEGSPLSLKAAELIDSMADRLELPKEPVPSARGVIVMYEPFKWKDGIERRDQRIEWLWNDLVEAERALERAKPWHVKARNVATALCAMWVYRKGPLG